jgi:hypothetical protein
VTYCPQRTSGGLVLAILVLFGRRERDWVTLVWTIRIPHAVYCFRCISLSLLLLPFVLGFILFHDES